MNSLEERLRAKINAVKNEKEIEVIQNIEIVPVNELDKKLSSLYPKSDFTYLDEICSEEPEEVKEFLKEKTIHLLIQDNLNKLKLGQILEEVFTKIGNNKNGLYLKWLEKTGINSRTALRYRNRYFLFNKVNRASAQQTILKLGHEDIERILEDENTTEKALNILENGGDKEKIKEFLNQRVVIEFKEKIAEEPLDLKSNIERISNEVNKKWEDIDNKKQRKINKLFKKIKEIIES